MQRISLVIVLLIGCGKSADTGTPAPAPAPVVAAPKPVATPSSVALVSPGAEPRQVLRYQLAKGSKSSFELDVDVDIAAGSMGGPIPTLVMIMDLTTDDVFPDGRMKVRSVVSKVTAKDRAGSKITADAMQQQAAILVGIGIIGTLSPNGTLVDAHLDFGDKHLPDEMQAELGQLTKGFERVALALPDQPVGVGARWTTTKEVVESGAHMTAVTTIELTKLEGTKLSFTRSAEISGPDQTIQQLGLEVAMKHIHGHGGGQGVLDLARMVLEGEMTDELSDELSGSGQTMQAAMTMKSTYKGL